MRLSPSLDTLAFGAANAFDAFLGGGVADLRPTPASIIDEGPQRTVFRYRRPQARRSHATPVLLVPPLAAPAACFDLRRGCSSVSTFELVKVSGSECRYSRTSSRPR